MQKLAHFENVGFLADGGIEGAEGLSIVVGDVFAEEGAGAVFGEFFIDGDGG